VVYVACCADGWPGENWVDINNPTIRNILKAVSATGKKDLHELGLQPQLSVFFDVVLARTLFICLGVYSKHLPPCLYTCRP
jgi:hypothetical protein